jgi:hypothetical protein
MDGVVDAPLRCQLRPGRKRCGWNYEHNWPWKEFKLLMTHMSRSPRRALAAPSDARCTRSDLSAFRENLAGRRHFG